MPNWCNNNLFVEGKFAQVRNFLNTCGTPAKQQKLTSKNDETCSKLDFNQFVPYPEKYAKQDELAVKDKTGKTKDGYNSGGREWCQTHWGTKWNAVDTEIELETNTRENTTARISFDTAWSPPTPVILAMSKTHPALNFTLEYEEGGIGFRGTFTAKNGKVVQDTWEDSPQEAES